MDPVHDRGSMDLVHERGPWTGSYFDGPGSQRGSMFCTFSQLSLRWLDQIFE